jgi:phosphoserine aminotransferase
MKNIYFTPGPSQLYPTVPDHIKVALKQEILSISHRSQRFEQIFEDTVDNLRQLMNIPPSHEIFFLSSSLEAMERILQNAVEKSSFHLVNGPFSDKWYRFSLDMGKEAKKIEVPFGEGFDLDKINISDKCEIICLTQNETGTGVMLPVDDIHRLKLRYPNKLLAVDIVSSVPYPAIDFSLVDIAFFSAQKGFGLPAGLSVLIVADKVLKKSSGTYHSFTVLSKFFRNNQTPETPNVLGIYLLGKVCQDMLKIGRKRIVDDIDKKAAMIYEFFEKNKRFTPFVKDKKFRSKTTVVLQSTKNENISQIVEFLGKKGMIVGKGYGKFKENQIRIANFPAHSVFSVRKLLVSL